jgi:divalent metal cation (Fe/Co/Zn/Cd) transporter
VAATHCWTTRAGERRERRGETCAVCGCDHVLLLAIYITWEAVKSLIGQEEPLTSPVGIILAVLSLAVMPTLAFAKQRVGKEMGSRALVADSKETWVCSYLSLSLLLGVGAYAVVGWWWADPVGALAMLPIILWQGWETLSEAREPANDED